MTTFNLEEMLRLGASHLESLVDSKGRTYFDVFLTEPPEAVFDWPDFIDLPARYWEAGVMVERALGRKITTLENLRGWLFGHIGKDGLAYRPQSPISEPIAELFDQSRLLYALVSVAMHNPADAEVRDRIEAMVRGLIGRATFQEDHAFIDRIGIYFGGTLIRPLVQAGLVMNREEWIDFAGKLARGLMLKSDLFKEDGSFVGHVHGALSAVAGTLAYAICRSDAELKDRAILAFAYARSISTEFGFVPELAQRTDDLISCETCTLMDYLDVAILLARHMDPQYWDIVEKAARNHLWESQFRDTSWLGDPGHASDDGDYIRKDLPNRMIGGFAGWSGPHCLLAYHECHNPQWVRSESVKGKYLGKVRAVQNCCAGGGIRAVYQVYSCMVSVDQDLVRVNLSLDRETPEVRVVSHLPFEGRLTIAVKRDCQLEWRAPSHCRDEEIVSSVPFVRKGGYLSFGRQAVGCVVDLRFPVPEKSEKVVVGNQGYQQYAFSVEWKGDTVMSIAADPSNARTGYTKATESETLLSFGDRGIGPIYQRDKWRSLRLTDKEPELTEDSAAIDWYTLKQV